MSACPNCGAEGKLHGQFYEAGIWGYRCDIYNQGRDLSTAFRRVLDIDNLPPDIQARMDAAEAAHQERQAAKLR